MSAFNHLIHDLKRQHPQGVTTWGPCLNYDKCGNSARGGDACADCVEKTLAAYVGNVPAANLRMAIYAAMTAEARVREIYAERVRDGDIVGETDEP